MIEFRGRVLISDTGHGEALITKKQLSFVKTFLKSAENSSKKLVVNDKAHSMIYKKNISDKVFVLPSFKKSDIDAIMLLSLAKKGNLPKCFLIAEELDEATVSAFCVLKAFNDVSISVIDSLGKDFLNSVETGDMISFSDDIVIIQLS